jgi:endoglucanase
MKICRPIVIGVVFLINTVALFGQADSIAPDHSGMSNLTSVEFAKDMVPGWNVGNSLEATGGETAWGNPKISQRLIDSLKAAGFKSIRIPVAWSKFTDATNYTIDTDWLNRVEEVVNYVLKDSMYAIINEHWDGGWQQPTYADSASVNHRLAAMWKQIAIHFRDYNDHLLFAGMNEVAVTNDYGLPTTERATVQNSFCQTFVNTVRSTGGRNVYRYLVVQGYRTDINATVGYFVVPTDVTENRLMVEVHYYDPYNFTINTGNGFTTQWGNNATIKTDTWANESYANGQFQKMKTTFIDKGYAVILGEYGVVARLNLGSDSLNALCAGYRLYYMQYITHSMFMHGLVPFYWDNGYTGNNGMGIFNRSTGAQAYPDIVGAIIGAVITGVMNVSPPPTRFKLMQNYPNPFNPQTTISYSLPRESTVTLKVYDVIGREVAALLHNAREPAGHHEVSFGGATLPSGTYFYRLSAEGFIETRRMVLIK